MARNSSIKQLPDKLLAQVNFLLTEKGWTIDQVVDYLSEAGHPVSRSAVGRYKQNVDKLGERLRQSREITEALVREIGPHARDGKQGRLLVEILRNLVFDQLAKQMDGEGEDMVTQDFFFLGKALKEMAQAARLDQDFDSKIREKIREEEREKAQKEVAGKVASAGRKAGLSKDVLEQMTQHVFGVTESGKASS